MKLKNKILKEGEKNVAMLAKFCNRLMDSYFWFLCSYSSMEDQFNYLWNPAYPIRTLGSFLLSSLRKGSASYIY
jgi:hypothetical protein